MTEDTDSPLATACKLARYHHEWRRLHVLIPAGKRAERVLAEYYGEVVEPEPETPRFRTVAGGKSLSQQVYEYHNGHPVSIDELQAQFPNVKRNLLTGAQVSLRNVGKLISVGRGITLKASTAALLVLFLAAGCATHNLPVSKADGKPSQPSASAGQAAIVALTPPAPIVTEAQGAAIIRQPPVLRSNVTYVIECETWPLQVFDVIAAPTPAGPWTHYTNVVQQDRFTVPTKLAANFFTIGRTWLVGNTNDVLRWEGW